MRKLLTLIREWSAPRWTRKQFLCGFVAYVLLCAVIPLAMMSSCYQPVPRAKKHASLCGYCMVAASSGPEWVRSCDGGCDEIV